MEFSITQVAQMLNGSVEGDEKTTVDRLEKIEEATPGSIAFLANMKYEEHIYTTKASAVIVSEHFSPKKSIAAVLIRVKDPYSSFGLLLEAYQKLMTAEKVGIEQPVFQNETAKLGKDIYLGAFTYVGDEVEIGDNAKIYPHVYLAKGVKVGKNTVIHSGVRIYENCVIGNDCEIHSGTVLGADGFGFAPQEDGTYKAIPQTGNVLIEDKVSIGSNCCIDRATMGSTIIRKGVKIDNLVQVAHNVEVGENTVIVSQTGISGSTKIGKNCVIAGQVGISGHISIADNTTFGPQSGVAHSVKKEGLTFMGSPAFDVKQFFKSSVYFKELPNLAAKVRELEKKP